MPDDPKPSEFVIAADILVRKLYRMLPLDEIRSIIEDAVVAERDRIKKIHETHRGMDWGVNEERFWREVEGD